MTPKLLLRRTVLIGAAACMLGFEPTPVQFRIRNKTSEPIEVRTDSDRPWRTVPQGKVGELAIFPHPGLCSPPSRWLPDAFTGFDIRRTDGQIDRIGRATFEEHAVWGRGPGWTFSVDESVGSAP